MGSWIALVAWLLALATVPHPAPSQTPERDAPLDRYFGVMKMSPIGIRQGIGFLGRNFTWRTMTDEQIVHDAQFIEDAMKAWQAQFPRDTWLPGTAFHLMQLYAEVQTPQARLHALYMLNYILAYWPDSKQAHLCRLRLTQGFPPFHEEPPMRPTIPPATPTPTPLPTPTSPSDTLVPPSTAPSPLSS